MEDLKQRTTADLSGAYGLIGQALGRLHPSLDITKEIKKIEASIGLVLEGLEYGDFDKEIK